MDLAEVRGLLQAESDELDILKVAFGVVYDDLQVVQAEGTSSLVARAVDITVRVCQLERKLFAQGSPKPSPSPARIRKTTSILRG